jgi:fibronectin-binding autotransporter adhesin
MKSLLSKVGVLILILTLVFPINAFPAKIVQAAAEVTTIGYEGYLTDSSDEALDSSEDFTVRIYNDPSLSAISNLLYEETHANVAINNGYFSIQMGSGSTTVVNADADGTANEAGEDSLSDLPFDAPYYVSLNITSLSTGEMTPRTSINAVAYANTSYGLIAQNSDPVNASKGQMYFKTTDNTVYVYDGAGWNALAMGGGGTFYTANGSITGARVVTMNAASTVTFDGSGDFVIDDTGALSATALTSTGLVTSVGLTTTGNITHTGAGTLSTGTGNVSLNGNTTVTGANTFTANGNSQFNGTVDINGTFNLDSATLSGSAISTDGTLGSNSNNLLSTQRAVKTYVDNSVNGLSWRPAADLFDDSTTDVAASMVGQAAYVIDTIAVADGDRVLFTAETTSPGTYDNRVFVVSGVGAAIVLTLETDGQAANGDPTEGDSLFVKDGTANGSKNYTYNGTDWVLAASVSGALVTSNNLSDVLDAAEAAANIGLGTTSVPTLMGVTLTGVTSTILKTDVTGAVSAAIAGTDYLGTALASGSILLGNAGGVATATGISGDATLSNAGVLTIAGNAVGTAEIADGTIALADLASDSVSAAKIVDGSIINADLANDAVNSAKILDASIALADMAADSVSSAKIVDGTIATADVANNAIDGTKIGLTGEATADMMYYNGTDWVVLAATGNANKVLQMNAGETAPTWVTGVTTNLYTANGTLTANRTVTTGGFSLTIDGTGDIVFSDSGNITTAGDLAVNGGDITSTGAITIDGTGTLTLADNVAQSGAGTFTTGTGLFTTGGAAAITGNTTMTGDLALNGGDLTTTGDLTITPAGGDINFSDNSTINIGGNPTDVLFNVIGDSSGGATSLNSDDDLYIEGNLEVDGSTQFDGTVAFNSAATFSAGLSCTDCLDFSSLADALSLDANTTLATGANTLTLTGIADMTGTVLSGSSPLVFEGTSLDANETTFAFADPTSDQTITFPDSTGTVALWGSMSGDATASNAGVLTIAANAIGTSEITDGTVSLADLNTDSVNSAKVVDGSITGTDLATNTVAGTNIALGGDAVGDMMYYNGTDWVLLTATGNANRVLQMNGTATAPAWVVGVTGNIYTLDGTLTANRTITSGGFSLTYDGAGDVVIADSGNISTTGDVAVNGGDLTSSAATLVVNAGGNVDVQDTLNADAITIDTTLAVTGNSTMTGDLALNGGDLTSTSDITVTSTGGDVFFADTTTLNIGGNATDVAFNAIGDSTAGATSLNSDDDLYIEGNLEVDGSTQFDGTVAFNSAATFSAGLSCTDCLDFSSLADALALDANTTLATGANTLTLTGIADMTGTVLSGASPLVFEGASLDANETTFAFTDPTSDQTITFPDSSGTVALWGSMSGDATASNAGVLTLAANSVASAEITDGSVSLADLNTDSVNSAKIVDASVALADLAGDSVNSAKVVDGSITGTDLAANTVTGTNIALGGDTAGDTMYYDGTDWVRLAIGTAGQFLATNGGATAPTWITGVTSNLYTADGTLTANRTITSGGFSLTYDGTGDIAFSDAGNISSVGLTTSADVAVNGGDLTTTSGTASLFNTNATTVNLAGAATALNVGAAGGLTVTSGGALTVNSAATSALSLDSGTTGSLSLGTGANAKSITIGNTTGATALTINSGADTTGGGVIINVPDNASDIFRIRQGANNYLDLTTTDGSELLAFGNAATDPSFSFLGSGTSTFSGALNVNDYSVFVSGLSAGSSQIKNVATPTDTMDAVNKAYVDAAFSSSVLWSEPVNDFYSAAAPGAPSTGDRYIILAGQSGFGCSDNNIVEYNGATWDCTLQATGTTAFVDNVTNQQFNWNGSSWVSLGSGTDHNALSNLQGGAANEYYHLELADYTPLTAVTAQLTALQTTGTPTFAGVTLTGQFSTSAGTVGAPGYAFSGDANTGLYNPAADTIGFSTGGALQMTLDSSGNLGIGDATPASPLTVGAGDAFQVSAAGAIIAATGITSSGILTLSSATVAGASPLVFEGTSVDGFETTFAITDPTAANTITFPDSSGTVALWGNMSGDATASNAGVLTLAANSVASAEITDGSVSLADLNTDSVNSSKIVDGSVTGTDLAANTVTGTNIALGGDTAGDTMYYDGTDWVRLAIGTAGQFLQVNGGATAPEWVTGATTNLYNANGTLSANRTITSGGFSLTYDGTGDISFSDAGTVSAVAVTTSANITAGGDVAVNGGDITSSAATLVVNAGGNVDIQDTLNADAITIDTTLAVTGNSTMTGDLALNGGDLTTTGDLTITPAGGDIIFSDATTFNVGGNATDVAFNAIGDSTAGATSLNSDDDLYIEGNLEVDGTTQFDGTATFNSAATFVAGLSCTDCLDFTSLADALALDAATSLATAANILTITSTTGGVDLTGTALQGTSALVFEGSSVDANETTFSITNPTGDNTITFPDSTGTVALWGAMSGDATASNAGVLTIAANAIGTSEITDGTVALADLAGDSVNSSKIVDGSIVAADVATNTIDGSHIAIGTTAGDTLYYDGTDWVRLGIGTAGQYLTTNGGATAPTWTTGISGNLYTANGTLTANRTITTGGFSLTIDGTGDIVFADSGDITTAGSLSAVNTTLSGDIAVNGGDLTSSAATLVVNAGGNVDVQDTLNADAITIDTTLAVTGNSTMTGDLALNGGDLTTTGDLTITPAGGDIIFSDATTFNVGGNATDVAFNAIGDSTAGATSLNSDDDLYIEGNLEVDGSTQFDGTVAFNSAATFAAGLSCTDCLDFTSLADALALDAATSLATAANILTITSTTGGVDLTGTALQGTSALVFEGSSVDANETTFSITNPTGDNTITFPDSSGTVALWGAMSGDATATNAGVLTIAANAIGTSEITDGTVALADLAANAVDSSYHCGCKSVASS